MLFPRAIVSVLLLFSLTALVWTMEQPHLSREAREEYDNHLTPFVQESYGGNVPLLNERWQIYSHHVVAHPNAEQEAFEFSKTAGNGPVFVRYGRGNFNAYAVTKIPSSSILGVKWGFRAPQIGPTGERDYRDIYAFWHVTKTQVRLIRLDAWRQGAYQTPIISWDAIRFLLRHE
ncbi:uncharacterized protein UTRI_10390_B [Ustilago trichophora]|uniref:Effector family protein Eff1 n=1 Tax=Ustilago trichophora TaxID=86804 RepID=A0A5C3EB96_9BASI|nr:uncharacterized protein UTRI_10390_B [Ustilago trichophora]